MTEKSMNYEAGDLNNILSTLVQSNENFEDEDVMEESAEEYFDQIPFSNFCSQSRSCSKILKENQPSNTTTIRIVTPIKLNGATVKDTSPKRDTPLTPTANLKVLLHAASPEIRSYERRKQLFNNPTNRQSELHSSNAQKDAINCQILGINNNVTKTVKEIINSCDSQATDFKQKEDEESNENNEIECPEVEIVCFRPKKTNTNSRKDKSLGLLCQRFLKLFPEYPKQYISICLDKAAKNLLVGRRRIYDIINVLESIKIVKRLAKSNYLWRGRIGLGNTISNIRAAAEESGLADKLRMNFNLLSNYRSSIPVDESDKSQSETSCERVSLLKRRDKSLGILSYQFVTLLVVQPDEEVSLDMAARVLITNGNPNDNKYKTKVRRLYDIANILTSLRLIAKIHCQGRRPTFSWVGNEVTDQEKPGLDSLFEVCETERKNLCLTTPNKKQSDEGSPTVTPVESNNAELNSSFNSDEVFQKELESLRKRFPSPMSRLLSACNVEEALSHHNAKKQSDKKEHKQESNDQKWKDAEDSYSADKLSLTYLEQQQKHISKTVDSIFKNNKLGLEQSNGNGMKKLYTNPIIEIKQTHTDQPLKTIVCNDGRVLVPISNLQFMNSQGCSNSPMLLPVMKPKMESKLIKVKENINLEENISPSVTSTQGLSHNNGANKGNAIQCQMLPSANGSTTLGGGKRPLVSTTNVNLPGNKRTHFTISADKVTSSQPKKFIKLDFNLKTFARANSEPIIKTYKPILKNLANQQNLGKIQKISTGKNTGSVVTNLFTRLEKEGGSQDDTGNFKRINLSNCSSLKVIGVRKPCVPLQPLLNLAANTNLLNSTSPAKIKRIKNPPRKLIMRDENYNIAVNGQIDLAKKIALPH